MTHEEAVDNIRRARSELSEAEKRADLAWRDKVSGLRAEFARDVATILATFDDDPWAAE